MSKESQPPSLDDMFCISVAQTLKIAKLLKITREQFLVMMKDAWVVDDERVALENKGEKA